MSHGAFLHELASFLGADIFRPQRFCLDQSAAMNWVFLIATAVIGAGFLVSAVTLALRPVAWMAVLAPRRRQTVAFLLVVVGWCFARIGAIQVATWRLDALMISAVAGLSLFWAHMLVRELRRRRR